LTHSVIAYFTSYFLDKLEPPTRDIESPLRLPISNVFKGQSSGIGVTGRVCGGIVQVGERLRVLPGDETAVVKCKDEFEFLVIKTFFNPALAIDLDERSVSWAAAGSNATLYLTTIDPIYLNIGSVLCPLNDLVPLATGFSARIIVFDIQLPITCGTSVCTPRRTAKDIAHRKRVTRLNCFIIPETSLRQSQSWL
jgi:elongation factor 1 alpha-like protein